MAAFTVWTSDWLNLPKGLRQTGSASCSAAPQPNIPTERRYTKLSFSERLKLQLENLTSAKA